jgi:hypothetical protein
VLHPRRGSRCRRRPAVRLLLLVSACLILGSLLATPAGAATRCVGRGGGCFSSLRQAVAAAGDGDTIRIGPGKFAGGVTIAKSLRIVGAGSGKTSIRGGGPVLQIGRFMGTRPPRVSISGLRIEGGRTHGNGVEAQGGGIYIPPAKGYRPGATVALDGVMVTGNVAKPTRTRGPGKGQAKDWPACPGGPCPFAIATGGGIDNWGGLTVRNSEVVDNVVAGRASDADGGGIASNLGRLKIVGSSVSRNRALASWPQARFAEGGGVFVSSGELAIVASSVIANSAVLGSRLPSFAGKTPIEMNANSGGVHVGEGVPTKVVNSDIRLNTLRADDNLGEPLAFDAAMLAGGPLQMRAVEIVSNHGSANSATSADVGPSGSILELDGGGTIEHLYLHGNTFRATALRGIAQSAGALANFAFEGPPALTTVSASQIEANQAIAKSPGSAAVFGGGVVNGGLLSLRRVDVVANSATALGSAGSAQGAGIWNGPLIESTPGRLTLHATTITENAASAPSPTTARGGGIFTKTPLSLTGSKVTGNGPEDCAGC